MPSHANGHEPSRPAAPRPASRAGGRRGRRQVHPGPAARDLAARPGLRRGVDPRARRDQGRDAAARAAARHRAHGPVAAGRDPHVRRGPGRARGVGDPARAGPRRDRGHRPVRGLLAGLPGRRPAAAARRGGRPEQVGHRRPGPRPHDPARPAPVEGLGRRERSADRLEAEPLDFHQRVRAGFLALADAEPERYLVLDATRPAAEISREIQDRIRQLLPDPVPLATEENTGSIPVVRD